jgi:hypothetical protein
MRRGEGKWARGANTFPVPTLFMASLLEDEQRLSMGEEVGTMQFLEFKGEQLKKIQRGANKKNQNSDVKVSLPNV